MIDGNLFIGVVSSTLDEPGERADVKYNIVSPEDFRAEVTGQIANIAPLAGGAVAATIVTKVNEILAALKAAGDMARDWVITNTFSHVTGNNTALVAPNATEYSTTLTADEGYTLPATVSVKVNGEEIESGFTYVAGTGVLTIASVEGDVEIIATATETSPESDPPEA